MDFKVWKHYYSFLCYMTSLQRHQHEVTQVVHHNTAGTIDTSDPSSVLDEVNDVGIGYYLGWFHNCWYYCVF